MLNQMQRYEIARRDLADANRAFMEQVNCKANPLTREDLARNIERRPAVWSRFSGFLKTLPSREDISTATLAKDETK